MKIINDFSTFYYNLLLEKSSDKLELYYSDDFKNILLKINDEISKKLLSIEDNSEHKFTKSFIDIDKDSNDKISFIIVNKIKDVEGVKSDIDQIKMPEDRLIFNSKLRSTMKINKFINDVFNNEYTSKKITDEEKEYNKEHGITTNAQKLEEFINKFKSFRDGNTKFELVKGDDIIYWYNYKRYSKGTGTMGNSCMRYNECGEYLSFYSKNPENVSLLILKDEVDNTKIIGRAIVWKLYQPSDRIFMDRIYTEEDSNVEVFKEYAKSNGWLYKNRQNMDESEFIFDPITNEKSFIDLVVNDMTDTNNYPYMDTLKYYDNDNGILTNNIDIVDDYIILTSTDGTYENNNRYTDVELVDIYVDEIMGDFEYYAENYFPNLVWNHINDERFISDIIDNEVGYYIEDFEDLVNNNFIIKYIRTNVDDDVLDNLLIKIDENNKEISLDDLNHDQLLTIVDDLDLKDDIAKEYTEDRYLDYSAKEYCEEMYGVNSTNTLSSDVYNQIENYIDMLDCAREYADNEDIDDLRERYQ